MTSFESILMAASNGATIDLTGQTLTGSTFTLTKTDLHVIGGTLSSGVTIYGATRFRWDGGWVINGIEADDTLLKFIGGDTIDIEDGEMSGGRCFGQLGFAFWQTPQVNATNWTATNIHAHHNNYYKAAGVWTPYSTTVPKTGHVYPQDHSVYITALKFGSANIPMNGTMTNCTFGPSLFGDVIKIGGTDGMGWASEGCRGITMTNCKIEVDVANAPAINFVGPNGIEIEVTDLLTTLPGSSTPVNAGIAVRANSIVHFTGNCTGAPGAYAAVDCPGTTDMYGRVTAAGAGYGSWSTDHIFSANGNDAASGNYFKRLYTGGPYVYNYGTGSRLTWTRRIVGVAAPVWLTTTITGLGVGTPASVTLAATSTPAATFTVQAGSALPAGLTLSSAGVITGTPTTPATTTFTLVATNAGGSQPQAFTVVIAATLAPTWLTTTMTPITAGTFSSIPLTTNSSTAVTYTVASGTLPTNMSLTGSSLAGSPTVPQTYTFSLRATNAGGSNVQPFTLVVNPPVVSPPVGICGRQPVTLVPIGDSYAAYSAHTGQTVASAGFVLWPGTTFYSLASGSGGVSGYYGLTYGADGTPNASINSSGHTPEGIMRERLFTRTPGWDIDKFENAVAGSTAAKWGIEQVARHRGHLGASYWDAIGPLLANPPAGRRLVLYLTIGGNDMFATFNGALTDPSPASQSLWDGTYIPAIKASMAAMIAYISELAGDNEVEVIWPSYPNLRVQDGEPVNYPPHGNTYTPTKAPLRCAMFTAGFGAYSQANYDNTVEVDRWATEKANVVPAYPSNFFGIPSDFATRKAYWKTHLQYGVAFDGTTIVTGALAQDLVPTSSGGAAHALDPLIWRNSLKNVTQQSIVSLFHKLYQAQVEIAADYAPGHPLNKSTFNLIHIDTRTSLNTAFPPDTAVQDTVAAPCAPQYLSANGDGFSDIHLSKHGFEVWCDYIIDQWFPQSMFADIVCTAGAVNDVTDVVGGGTFTGTITNVTTNDNAGGSTFDTTSVQVFNTSTSTWVTTRAMPGVGTWTVTSPAIAFVPSAGFVGSAQIQYRVRTVSGVYASAYAIFNVSDPIVVPPVEVAPPAVTLCSPQTTVFVP